MAPDDLPTHAHERLREMRGQDGKPALFTSDLSVNEFLLVKEAGFEPLGLVMGCSVYHIGYQQASWSKNEEMTVLTQAMYHARELAMERMQEEARELGADGIVGVRLVVKPLEWSDSLAPGNVQSCYREWAVFYLTNIEEEVYNRFHRQQPSPDTEGELQAKGHLLVPSLPTPK